MTKITHIHNQSRIVFLFRFFKIGRFQGGTIAAQKKNTYRCRVRHTKTDTDVDTDTHIDTDVDADRAEPLGRHTLPILLEWSQGLCCVTIPLVTSGCLTNKKIT